MFLIKSSGFGVSPFGVTTFFLATGAGTNSPGTTLVEYCAVISVSWMNVPVIFSLSQEATVPFVTFQPLKL